MRVSAVWGVEDYLPFGVTGVASSRLCDYVAISQQITQRVIDDESRCRIGWGIGRVGLRRGWGRGVVGRVRKCGEWCAGIELETGIIVRYNWAGEWALAGGQPPSNAAWD